MDFNQSGVQIVQDLPLKKVRKTEHFGSFLSNFQVV
jgi:hypothetical protein